jgi:putative hydrolase of the HAD superfamily
VRALPPVLLLDLDDTVVHFTRGRPDFWLGAFEAHRRQGDPDAGRFSQAVAEVARDYWADAPRAARGRLDLWRARREVAVLAFERLGLPPGEQQRAHAIADAFTAAKEEAVAPFDGAVAALETLRARGVRLGLVTNGHPDFQRRKLERHDLGRFFEAVLIEGEWGVGKPDPTIFHEALARMRARPEDAWMVGDNLEADIGGASAVGLKTVWVDHVGSGLGDALRPDRVIRHIAELVDTKA